VKQLQNLYIVSTSLSLTEWDQSFSFVVVPAKLTLQLYFLRTIHTFYYIREERRERERSRDADRFGKPVTYAHIPKWITRQTHSSSVTWSKLLHWGHFIYWQFLNISLTHTPFHIICINNSKFICVNKSELHIWVYLRTFTDNNLLIRMCTPSLNCYITEPNSKIVLISVCISSLSLSLSLSLSPSLLLV